MGRGHSPGPRSGSRLSSGSGHRSVEGTQRAAVVAPQVPRSRRAPAARGRRRTDRQVHVLVLVRRSRERLDAQPPTIHQGRGEARHEVGQAGRVEGRPVAVLLEEGLVLGLDLLGCPLQGSLTARPPPPRARCGWCPGSRPGGCRAQRSAGRTSTWSIWTTPRHHTPPTSMTPYAGQIGCHPRSRARSRSGSPPRPAGASARGRPSRSGRPRSGRRRTPPRRRGSWRGPGASRGGGSAKPCTASTVTSPISTTQLSEVVSPSSAPRVLRANTIVPAPPSAGLPIRCGSRSSMSALSIAASWSA